MAKRLEELDEVIAELRNDNLSLQEQLAKELSEKLEAINCHLREKEGRIAAEKLQATLLENLEKCKQESLAADRQIAFQKDMYKSLHEYNTSLQQYNSNLQTYLSDSNYSLKRVKNEKLTILGNLGALRSQYTALQEQLTSCKALGDEAIKQKESFAGEVKCLREELQQVIEDRDNQRAQVQAISAGVLKCQESTGELFMELDKFMINSNTLQETCSAQTEQIRNLQNQLAYANEKLKMASCPADEPHFVNDSKEVIDLELRPHTSCRKKRKKKFPAHSMLKLLQADGVSPPCQSSGCSRKPYGKASAGRSANVRRSLRLVDSTVGEKCPLFEVIICKSAADGKFLHVPNSFSKGHLKGARASNRATLKFNQRSWQIELIDYGALCIRMMGGWRKFTMDNYLRMRDICIFKLVDKMHLVFEVSISKH